MVSRRIHTATGMPLHEASGLPLYRTHEIPAHLGTVAELKRRRLRPAKGQQPAGMLFYHGNKHTELYTIADAVPMPALSSTRQAAYDAARTCYRCATVSTWRLSRVWRDGEHAGKRRCDSCADVDERTHALARAIPGRLAATEWARGVLADPTTVLVGDCLHQTYTTAQEIHAEKIDGTIVLSMIVENPHYRGERPDRAMSIALATDFLPPLGGYRLVGHWGTLTIATWVRAHQRRLIRDQLYTGELIPELGVADTDGIDRRWNAWAYHSLHHRPIPLPTQPAAAIVANVRGLLERMALDVDHPDGPALCPMLPPTGVTPCGGSVPCPVHPLEKR